MKSYLTVFDYLLIIILLSIAKGSIIVSPFDYSSVYGPSGMYRMSYSANLVGTSSTFTLTFPSSFISTPIVLYSISSLTYSKGIKFSLTISATTNSSMTANMKYDSTVSKASYLFLAMDSSLYNAAFTFFTYTMPAGVNSVQTFVITGNQNHDASFLIGLQATMGPFPSGYAPEADSSVLIDTSNIITASLSIVYDPSQLAINSYSVYFVDFAISSFKAKSYLGIGLQFAIYGTNGFATDTTQTGAYISTYSNSYFTGLQTIYDGQFMLGTQSFDIINMLNTNVYYYISELLFVAYKCPGSFPYIDNTRTYCYNDCDIGFYGDDQYICQPCNANCYTCYNMSTNCTSCFSPYELVYGHVCACNERSYQITNLNGSLSCILCSTAISGCYSCTSATHCTLCMNNNQLITPLICICPAGTVLQTVGTDLICVQLTSVLAPTSQYCPGNMVMNYTTCTCPKYLNMTFVNGNCIAI